MRPLCPYDGNELLLISQVDLDGKHPTRLFWKCPLCRRRYLK